MTITTTETPVLTPAALAANAVDAITAQVALADGVTDEAAHAVHAALSGLLVETFHQVAANERRSVAAHLSVAAARAGNATEPISEILTRAAAHISASLPPVSGLTPQKA